MTRSICFLLICSATVLLRSQELASLAASPYELARYVETHRDFDWQPLWQALGIKDQEVFLPPCEENFSGVAPCSSELITVADPLQMIVLLEHQGSHFQVLRPIYECWNRTVANCGRVLAGCEVF